jgi:hypothetical protein
VDAATHIGASALKNKKIMKWTKLQIAWAAVTLLILTNLFTLMLLLHHMTARSPGHSKPASDLKVAVERIDSSVATSEFKFTSVPSPAKTNAATYATFSLVTGRRDDNSGGLEKLQRGYLPSGPDAPAENFFFADGSYGGRILVDLNQETDIQQVNTYSWHTDARSPQLYKLYARNSLPDGANPESVGRGDPMTSGWKFLADVDTRPASGDPSGQYGVSITSANGFVGHYRYLLFDCKRTEEADRWGNTFYCEIDVIAK